MKKSRSFRSRRNYPVERPSSGQAPRKRVRKRYRLKPLSVVLLFGLSLLFVVFASGRIPKAPFAPVLGVQTSMPQEAEAKEADLKITLVGDTGFGSQMGRRKSFDAVWKKNGPAHFTKGLKKYWETSDLNIANLENVFTESTDFQKGKKYTYKAHRFEYVDFFKEADIQYVNIVNNHMADYKQKGLDDTLKLLKQKDIKPFGTSIMPSPNPELGKTNVDLIETFEKDGIKVGLCGFLAYETSYATEEVIKERIQKLKEENCDFIIANMHGGGQNTTALTDQQKVISRQIIDHGADVVIGHHPHVIQKLEHYKDKPIYYSLGNFLFIDYAGSSTPEALMVGIDVKKNNKGEITAKYTNIPILWTGSASTNLYVPKVTEEKRHITKIERALDAKTSSRF